MRFCDSLSAMCPTQDISGDSSQDTSPLTQWTQTRAALAGHLNQAASGPLPPEAIPAGGQEAGEAGKKSVVSMGGGREQDGPLSTPDHDPYLVTADFREQRKGRQENKDKEESGEGGRHSSAPYSSFGNKELAL